MEKQNRERKYYTAGEIADLAGVTVRTIRYYDGKGLLKPVGFSESGYRYYDEVSLEKLQKILMLKFLGFPLKQIQTMVSEGKEASGEERFRVSLSQQKQLLEEKKKHLEDLIDAVEAARCAEGGELWEKLLEVMRITTYREDIAKQYQDDGNLQKRISIHAYSTAEVSWMQWLYERMGIRSGMKILEIGCGNGLLWKEVMEELPENLDIYLTDYSEGMLKQAKAVVDERADYLAGKNIRFRFAIKDAEEFEPEETGYDLIIANHMLYHVIEHRQELLVKIRDLLKEDGVFCCSTVGERHMRQLDELAERLDKSIKHSITEGFTLENGEEQLLKVFTRVEKEEQENNLLVDDVEVIYNYVCSWPGNTAEILAKKGDEFRRMIGAEMAKTGAMFIEKQTGFFRCRK